MKKLAIKALQKLFSLDYSYSFAILSALSIAVKNLAQSSDILLTSSVS